MKITGLDLKTDSAIQEMCKNSNATSSSSRSVLYVVMLITVMVLIAIINSYMWSWGDEKKDYFLKQQNIVSQTHCKTALDSTIQKFKLADIERKLDSYTNHLLENNGTVQIPFLGNSFDVNDLGLIAGVGLLILLVILRFTLSREINNLILAFNSITERYPPDANFEEFEFYLKKFDSKEHTDILKDINYTRRQHHYNYLSMNEIFIMPPLEILHEDYKKSKIKKVLSNIYWFPCIVYILIILNDLSTIKVGLMINPLQTWIALSINLLFIISMLVLCYKCTRQKDRIESLYESFINNNYRYVENNI